MSIFKNTRGGERKEKTQQSQSKTGNQKKGFASMPKEKVKEIAHEGGKARAEQAGHEGMADMGRKGGAASHRNR